MILVYIAFTLLLATTANSFCFPGEDLKDCAASNKDTDDVNEKDNETPCLGVDLNNGGEGKPYFL